ncbi:MAG: S-methyl-5-thioribose-1-phosphate isomerase [Anaerolineales bacterium]|nr:S-methyl-5-thioribose-1-phosphate isomerase [Anaerolineales bacterium]MCB9127653.1 S-methyl-5-thioribose-1-phosphate isomerase [Ardenticatenales bacterium]
MRTIEWVAERNVVRMIDQRLLPHEEKWLEFDRYQAVAHAIRTMVIRGAPAIGAAAGFGMALAALQSEADDLATLQRDLDAARAMLYEARPTAVNLRWALERMDHVARRDPNATADGVRAALQREAMAIADEDVAINQRMGAHGAALLPAQANVLHHCNTGGLATVDWGTALGVIRSAHESGKQIHVWVDETRPRLQGARLTTWELMKWGIPHTLIADNAAGYYMLTGQVDAVLVGADRIAANGDTVNKIGTYKLAAVAKDNDIPFYVVAPTSTIDLRTPTGREIPIEERDPREVTHPDDDPKGIAPEGVRVGNPAFDITPHRLVTAIITEHGPVFPPYGEGLREAVEKGDEARLS